MTELPLDFGDLNKLTRLDLYGNKLQSLPLSFARLNRLKWLDLKGNPLEQTLQRAAGDCANDKQCQMCAANVIKYVAQQKVKAEQLFEEQQRQLQQQKEKQLLLQQSKEKQRQKRKAKNMRKTAKKSQHSTSDDNDDGNIEESGDSIRSDSNAKSNSKFWCLLRTFIYLTFIITLSFVSVAIGTHLQSGRKLQSIDDLKTALQSTFLIVSDYYHKLVSDVSILLRRYLFASKELIATLFNANETKLNNTNVNK